MTIRDAIESDLDAIVALSSGFRDKLQALEPTFWKRHSDADSGQRAWFAILLGDENHHLAVSQNQSATIDGFVIARAGGAPPVYDPGGATCMVDDFVWETQAVAQALIEEVRRWATTKACTQLVVVTPAADAERKATVEDMGLHPTSEWWSGPI